MTYELLIIIYLYCVRVWINKTTNTSLLSLSPITTAYVMRLSCYFDIYYYYDLIITQITEMIQDVTVEIQLNNSRKENWKGTCHGLYRKRNMKWSNKLLLLSGHFNFWGCLMLRQPMKCSGKPIARGVHTKAKLVSCWTSDFFPGQAKMKCDLFYMTSGQKC